jgi:WD40 repeat protein
MVPSRRLATLFDQARRHQQESCLYHDETDPPSLYVDHECSSGQFPSITTHILADHTDEVWNIQWSPDGMLLASNGRDQTVVIWELKVGTTRSLAAGVIAQSRRSRQRKEVAVTIAWHHYTTSKTTGMPSTQSLGLPTARHWSLELIRACTFGMSR